MVQVMVSTLSKVAHHAVLELTARHLEQQQQESV
jgi:hypothetical protein